MNLISSPRRWMVAAGLIALITSCGLLDTEQPDIIQPGDLDTPEGAIAKAKGARAQFSLAADGDGDLDEGVTEGHILLSGLMADEFVLSTTPPTEQEFDQRRISILNGSLSALALYLHRARASAEDAETSLRKFGEDPDSDPLIPEMQNLAGFIYVYFAEDFCSGVPVSQIIGDSLVFGVPLTTDEMLNRAITKFDSALVHPAVTPALTRLATVGKARAMVNLGQFATLPSLAGVPTGFSFASEHSTSPASFKNAIFGYTDGFLWSIPDAEGGNGLPYLSATDPRVLYRDEGTTGLDNTTPQFTLLNYADAAASVPIASGIEARLIEAEQALRVSGDTATMRTILNTLRQTVSLGPLATPPSIAAAEDMLFSERAFWLFATGHRLGDMRRLVKPAQYDRPQDTVFPVGSYLKGGVYGTDVNMPIPVEELNNPNSQGCIDREP